MHMNGASRHGGLCHSGVASPPSTEVYHTLEKPGVAVWVLYATGVILLGARRVKSKE